VREVLVGDHRIVYGIQKAEIRVLTVFEGHHRFPKSAIEPKDSHEESER